MDEVSTVGLDIAKSVFQVHGGDSSGEVVVCKRVRPLGVLNAVPSETNSKVPITGLR